MEKNIADYVSVSFFVVAVSEDLCLFICLCSWGEYVASNHFTMKC